MSLIDMITAMAVTVRNERKKEANSNVRIGDLFLAIIEFIKSVKDGEIRQNGVDTYNDISGGKTSLLSTYPNPELNWTVLVRKDENSEGKSTLYKWNSITWVDIETVVYLEDIVTQADIHTQFLLPNNFTQGEVQCASAIKTIEVFGIRDIIKIHIFINNATFPYRMALYNETKNESSDWFFNGKSELVKNIWGGKIRIVADWLTLGDNYINTSPEKTRFTLSEKCYQISPSFTDMAETFTGSKTFERPPAIPMAISANNPITYAQFADLVVEPIDFTIAELACISAIKHFSVEGSTDMFKIGILINNAEFKTRLWLYNTTRNRVEKLEFKGNSSITYITAEGAKIGANVNWVQLGNNGINATEANARLVISARCYVSSISALLSSQDDVAAFCGDSIMAQMSGFEDNAGLDIRGYPRLQKQLAFKEVINCAIGGGTWQDRTVITDKPTESTAETTGGISNQILKLKRLVSEGRPTPNLIVIAAGTNSSGGRGDYDTIMAMTYDELKADLETRRTFYGGMRYSIELAMREFPNAQIMLFAPIQSTDHPNRTFELLLSNAKAIEQMANRYAIPFVNSLFESGINDLVNSKMYLSDQVHLTELGKDKYSAFIASKISQYYNELWS